MRRIRGQIEAIERGLESGAGCSETLQTVAAVRGALNGLVAVMIEDHVRHHVLDKPTPSQAEAAEELIEIVRAYVK